MLRKFIMVAALLFLVKFMFCQITNTDDCADTIKYDVSCDYYNPNIPAARSCMPVVNRVWVTRQCFGGFWYTTCIPNLSPTQYQFIWYVQNTLFDSLWHKVDASFGVLNTDTGAIMVTNSMASNAKYWYQGGRTFIKLVVTDRFDNGCDTFETQPLFAGSQGYFLPKDFGLQTSTGDTCGIANRLIITTARSVNHLDDSLFLESQAGGNIMAPSYLRADRFHVWDSTVTPPKKLFEIGKLPNERGVRLDTCVTLPDSLQGRRLGVYMQTSCGGGIGSYKKYGITVPYLDTCPVAVVLPPDTVTDTTVIVVPVDTTGDTTVVVVPIPIDTFKIPIGINGNPRYIPRDSLTRVDTITVDTTVSGINETSSETKVWFYDGVLKTTSDEPITVVCTDLLGRETKIGFEKQIFLRSVIPPGFYLVRVIDSKITIRIIVP